MKKTFYAEWAYVLGIIILALGTALMERADFGMSMVVAPAYVLHLHLVKELPFFSFGMAEYVLQGVLIVLLAMVMRGMKRYYLLSFATAVIYGFALDGAIGAVSMIPFDGAMLRPVYYLSGMLLCSLGVALLLHTYIAPEAYELFVKELVQKHGWPIGRVKTVYDCVSCAVSVVLSFAFFGFGHFEGVKWGTILCALVNGYLIGWIAAGLERRYIFRDALPMRKFFEK